jgi:hypothetical protein
VLVVVGVLVAVSVAFPVGVPVDVLFDVHMEAVLVPRRKVEVLVLCGIG